MEPKTRRERLDQLLKLAQTYRGWNRRQLAKALGRDTTKLVPESGLPKLDLLMDLARALDWSVSDVAHYLWHEDATRPQEESGTGFAETEAASRQQHRDGSYGDAVRLAQQAFALATTGEQRAIACNREASALEGLGRYKAALDSARRGLAEPDVSNDRRLILQSNLANAYYSLWHLIEARGTAQYLVGWYSANPPTTRFNRVVQAHAYYVRGHTYRRLMATETDNARACAQQAKDDLLVAARLFENLSTESGDESYRGVEHTCRGGILEIDAALGTIDATEAVATFVASLNKLNDAEAYPTGDWLESYGWWCILGCNVALRHLNDERDLQKCMAVFTTKADEIAERLDNWALRERVLTMEYVRRQRFTDWTGVPSDWTINKDDVRIIAGAMGRFPAFQATGWRILASTKVAADN